MGALTAALPVVRHGVAVGTLAGEAAAGLRDALLPPAARVGLLLPEALAHVLL